MNPHIEDVTRRAAAAGYHAVAPDFFHRSGPGRGRRVRQVRKGDGVLPGARRATTSILADVDVALASSARGRIRRQQDRSRRFLLRRSGLVPRRAAARARRVRGLLRRRHRHRSFPAVPAAGRAKSRRCRSPWLGLFGDQDAGDSRRRRRATARALEPATVDTEIVRYADAGHGFHCDQRPDYRADDAADAWRRALDWFAHSHLNVRTGCVGCAGWPRPPACAPPSPRSTRRTAPIPRS